VIVADKMKSNSFEVTLLQRVGNQTAQQQNQFVAGLFSATFVQNEN